MSKRYITNGLKVIIYLFVIMYPQIAVKAYYQNGNCNHTNWVYHSEISPYIDDDNEIIDGRIAYYFCTDCGRYAKDVGFTNLMSADEIIDYYVFNEIVVNLGGDSLKSSDIMITPMGFERVSYDGINFSKYKYISSHSTTGKLIKTTKDTKLYKNTLKPITIKVITKCADPNKKVKYVKVRFELPKPRVKIKKKWNGDRCTYTFMYNVKGASKIKVRMFNGKTIKLLIIRKLIRYLINIWQSPKVIRNHIYGFQRNI